MFNYSFSSKVLRDIANLSFIDCDQPLEHFAKEHDKYTWVVTLMLMSFINRKGGSDDAAKTLVEAIVKKKIEHEIPKKSFVFEVHPRYQFNGKRSDDLPKLHTTERNEADVGVCLEGTNLVNIEVNSPMIETVRKVIYGLVELLHVVKAHSIKEPSLIRFALPN